MASVGIIDVYDKIIQSDGDYCKVCFRTSRERKLVTPVFFGRFLIAVNNCSSYNTDIKICFVCEHLAKSAMKFHRAMMFGLELEELFRMIESEGVRDQVLRHFDGVRSNSKVCPQAKACETKYQELQESLPYSLQCTNTLLVAVDAAPAAPPPPPAARKPQGPRGTATTNDVVVILDDDEPMGKLAKPIRPPVAPTTMESKGDNLTATGDTNKVLLHPIVTGFDGKIYVPSLNLQVLPYNDFRNVSDLNQPNTKTNTHKDKATARIEKLTMGYNYQDFLRLQNEQNGNNEMISTDNLNIVLNFDDCESSSKKIRFEEDPLDIETVISDPITSANERNVENGIGMKNDGKEKRPVLSMARVDWEDKIPMDVISFMDATDPNPDERIMQPNSPALGVISNVRSEEGKKYKDGDVQIVDNIECIDLC